MGKMTFTDKAIAEMNTAAGAETVDRTWYLLARAAIFALLAIATEVNEVR
jgi:hypothetical protein